MSVSDDITACRDDGAPVIIAIDGPAGVGKSTLARRLAETLGVTYLDTGAMFRIAALRLSRSGIALDASIDEAPSLAKELDALVFSIEGVGGEARLICNGVAAGDEIRTEEAGMMAAQAGKSATVRAFLKKAQQRLGGGFSLVAEGRDMGTAVFPGALCKIFLDASLEIRAERRRRQLREMGREGELRAIAEQIRKRDEEDRKRALAPLRPAADAERIDTSDKDIDAVFLEMLTLVGEAGKKRPPARPMRRKKRALSRQESLGLLERAAYGVLAVDEGSGWPYAVPLSYVLMDGAVYFHCALDGRKVDAMRANSRVCFTVTGETEAVYDGGFSTCFESVIVQGRAMPVEDPDEKYRGLCGLAKKYLPADMDKADGDIRSSYERTALYRVSLDRISGKAKRKK